MKRQTIIYTLIIFAVVCAVLIPTITFISGKGALSATNIPQEDFNNIVSRDITPELSKSTTNVAQEDFNKNIIPPDNTPAISKNPISTKLTWQSKKISQEEFKKNLVPRDITEELAKIKGFLSKAEMPDQAGIVKTINEAVKRTIIEDFNNKEEVPDEREIVKTIRDAVERAIIAWDECQELVNSRKLRHVYNAYGTYMASYEDDVNKIEFKFDLQSEKGEFRECNKAIPDPEGDGNKMKAYYALRFNDDFNMSSYQDPNTRVAFYPSGLIGGVSFDMPEGKRYSVGWSEDGKISGQRIYKKRVPSKEAIEARKKEKEQLEMEMKYFEEYKKMMNMDDANFNIDIDHYNKWISAKFKDPNN